MTIKERDLFDIWADLSFAYYKIREAGVPVSEHTKAIAVLLKELKDKAEEVKSEETKIV